MDELNEKYAYIFVTYTIRNCSAEELNGQVNALLEALYKLHKKSSIRRAFKGHFRALEITHNKDKPQSLEYHPHIHVIYAVNKSYFKNNTYIKNQTLAELWAECLKLDYYPQVQMKRIKAKSGKEEIKLKNAVKEVAKYTVKGTDYLKGTEEEIDKSVFTLIGTLASRRLCAFGGCFKEAAKKLKLDDLDEGDLIHTDIDKIHPELAHIVQTYKWQIGYGYYLAEEREMQNNNL